MTDNNILAQASKNLLLVELKGIGGWTPNVRLKDASAVLAKHYGSSSDKAFKGTENMLPPPHDEEFKELKAAFGAVRQAFYAHTMPFGSTVDAKSGKVRAEGKRAVVASKIADGSFFALMDGLQGGLAQTRERFAEVLPTRVATIRAEAALGSQFDEDRYPTPEEVRRGWYYEAIVPEPILDAARVASMGLPPEVAQMIEENLARKVESQVSFGQQQLVDETLRYIKTMVTNLTKLNAYFNGQSEGKRPAIFDSLVDNVSESLAKLRTYALPGTAEGDAVLRLADGIEQRLDMESVDASLLRNDGKITERVLKGAKEATKLIDAWAGSETVFDEPAMPMGTQKIPQPPAPAKPEPEELDMDALLAGLEDEPPAQPEEKEEKEEKEEEEDATDADNDIDDLLAGW